MKNEFLLGGVGAALGVVGTATQMNEILQTISLIVTILGALVSFVVVPLLSWYKNAKKDGKITADEAKAAAETLAEGMGKVKKTIDEEKKGGNSNG